MGYHFEVGESFRDGVRRIAREQIDAALIDLEADDRHQAVHEFRKRCKKIRALVRLVRPAFGDGYRRENDWFRDAARRLSDLRDATSRIETTDALAARFQGQVDRAMFASIREEWVRQRDEAARARDLDRRVERCREALVLARDRVDDWKLDRRGFEAVGGGFGKTYRRARRAMARAYETTTTEALHQWRKRVKYHRYHVDLLRDAWRPVLDPWREQLHALTDRLGDDHDLAVFLETLERSQGFDGAASPTALSALVVRRRAELQAEARPLGERLFAESPKRIVERHRIYWCAARAWESVESVIEGR
jgi:CHAD domain-containing protein